MIKLYCCDISSLSKEQYNKLYSLASKERQQRAKNYLKYEDSVRCLVGEALLRYCLREKFGKEVEPRISYNKHQKPYIENMEKFFFNISHSGKWVVFAHNSKEIGVDIEKIKSKGQIDSFAKRFFTEKERMYIEENPEDKEKCFTEIWTGKEAYMKYLGTGLSEGLTTFSIDGKTKEVYDKEGKKIKDIQLCSWWIEEEYVLSACSDKTETRIERVSVEEIL